MGFDLPRSLGYAETGGRNAAPIFVNYFRAAARDIPVDDFVPPPGVEFVRIDQKTGLRASRKSQKVQFEVFLRGTAPTQYTGSKSGRADAIFRSEGLKLPAPPARIR